MAINSNRKDITDNSQITKEGLWLLRNKDITEDKGHSQEAGSKDGTKFNFSGIQFHNLSTYPISLILMSSTYPVYGIVDISWVKGILSLLCANCSMYHFCAVCRPCAAAVSWTNVLVIVLLIQTQI